MKFGQNLTIISKVTKGVTFMEQGMEVNMNKVVTKILQGSVVTETMIGGLTIHRPHQASSELKY